MFQLAHTIVFYLAMTRLDDKTVQDLKAQSKIMHAYQFQNSRQTLTEGIAEYFDVHMVHFNTRENTPEAGEFFRCHDTAHVIFGCDISLTDEAIVKLCSLFGTTAKWRVLTGYNLTESKDIYSQLKIIDIFKTIINSLGFAPVTLWRCKRMTKLWPWDDYAGYSNRSLADIRKEFGINVPHNPAKGLKAPIA